ncbi:MAG: hypothetical protein IJP92_14455, partial [Lachnospiraceae bacterium]|nr:hypothetical protein [Lachnospiraceae bacterium]
RTGWLQSAGLVLIGYLPWLTVFLQSVKRTADSHWMPETEPFIQCYKSLFSARLSIIWPTAWLIVVFVLAVRDLRKPEREKEDEGRLSPFVIWLLIGVMAVFGTILTGYLVSALTRPVFNSRYLYPASIIAWVSLAAALERVKYKRVIVLTVLPVFLVLQTLSFFNRWQTGAYREQLTKKTVEKIWEETAEGAILLSKEPLGGYDDQVIMDMGFPTAPVTDYYFRGITEELRIDPETPEDWMLSPDKRYFLFLYEPLSEKDIRAIEEKGMHCDMLVEDGRIRNTKYTVYYLTGASPAP